jgi:hypothetical protein
VGLNGPYRLDTNHDGSLLDETPNTSAAGFELTGLDLGLALFQDSNKVANQAARSWLSLAATAAQATQVGLPLVDIRAEDLKLDINVGSDGSVVDHSTAMQVATGGKLADGTTDEFMTLDFKGSQGTLVRASGYLEVEVDGFFSVAGNLGFEKSTRAVTLADGTELDVDTLSFGGQNLRAFAGVNGPYWQDTDGNGVFSEAEANPESVGMAMREVSFALVLADAAAGAEAGQGLQWTALKAQAGSVAFVGVPDVSLAARDLAVDINLVSGVDAKFDADAKVIDFTAGDEDFKVVTGTNKTLTLDMAGETGQLVRASGTMDMRIGDFFQFSGSMGLERRAQDVNLADGTTVQTEMLSVGGTGLTGFVGLGPYGSDTNGNGKFDTNEVNPDAKGLGVRDVEFGLAIFNGKAAYADTQWLAMTGSVGGVDLMLGLPDDLKLQVYDLGLDLNRVLPSADAASTAQVIDFAGDRAISVTTGTGQALQLTHDGARGELMRASGGMQLSLAGFVHAGGTLAIEKSSQSVVLADGKSVQTDMLTVGGTDLQMFVGVGGPYRSDTNGDGVVNTDDDINDSAIGLSAVGGEFALGLFYEKSLTNSRNWIALQASLDEVAMVGVPTAAAAP